MSNPVVETNEVIATAEETAATEPAKKGFIGKTIDGVRKTYLKIRSTKGGRIVIGGTKAMLIGLGLYETYKLGQKSVTPTVVTIMEGVDEEEAPAEEPAAEEANDPMVEETAENE